MAVREAHPQSLAFLAAPVTAGNVGGGPGTIDEHEAFWFEIDLTIEPVLALPQDVGTVLFARVSGLFARDPMTHEEAMHRADLDRSATLD